MVAGVISGTRAVKGWNAFLIRRTGTNAMLLSGRLHLLFPRKESAGMGIYSLPLRPVGCGSTSQHENVERLWVAPVFSSSHILTPYLAALVKSLRKHHTAVVGGALL